MTVLLGLLSICCGMHAQVDTISTNIFQMDGKLGIGTQFPANALSIAGTEEAWPGRVFLSVYNRSAGPRSLAYIMAKAGSSENHTIFGHISETYAANDAPGDLQDFGMVSSSGRGLILGATKNNLQPGIIKFVSGQSKGTAFDERMRIDTRGRVGIGTRNPSSLLSLESMITSGTECNLLRLNNLCEGSDSYTGILMKTGKGSFQSAIQDYGVNYSASRNCDFAGFLNVSNNAGGLILNASSAGGTIKFYAGYDQETGNEPEKMRIAPDGNVGIGTKEPACRLQVADGDIYISEIDRGIVMTSPDGQCWRGLIDNAGTLQFTKIACPGTLTQEPFGQLKSNERISVFPNPAAERVTLRSDLKDFRSLRYTLTDLNGRTVDQGKIILPAQTLDISSLSGAVYLLNVYDRRGNLLVSERIIKE